MLATSVQRALVVHPTPIYLAAIFILAVFALQITPAFVPLVILLTTLRLFTTVVTARRHVGFKLALVALCLATATTLTNLRSSLTVIPEVHTSTTIIIALFVLTVLTSALIIFAVLLEVSLSKCHRRGWSQFILFPTVWSSVLLVASSTSPLGYLATWTPSVGLVGYSWLRPIFGPTGIDWVVGAWAAVLSDLVGSWIMGSRLQIEALREDSEESLISTDQDGPDEDTSTTSSGSTSLLATVLLLCLGIIPSYFQDNLPTPVNSESTTPLSVACALPYVGNTTKLPSFDDFLTESTILTSLARVVLWPGGAVFFDSEQAKQDAITKIANSSAASVVGVSFIDRVNLTKREDKLRNGFMLIDRDGLVFEYFKRHLVPFVDAKSMIPYSSPPQVFNYQLITKRNSRNKPVEFLTVPITGSICMDFAHPMPFSKLPRRPSLILGPSWTWHPSVSLAMWEQAKARAEEIGSAILWCDGGSQGISGVGGRGMEGGEVVQVGPGSWVRNIGLETQAKHERTAYTLIGPWLSVLIIWILLGAEKMLETGVCYMRNEEPGSGMRLRKKIIDAFVAWRKGRQAEAPDEHTHLL